MRIPKSHPRYNSLIQREKVIKALKKEILAKEGLIAHGRGECFDYLIGERTTEMAERSEKTAIALLILAENPIISINGNVCALASKEIVRFVKELNKVRKGLGKSPCFLEINIFYRTKKRVLNILRELNRYSKEKILYKANAKILYLKSKRALCCKEGTYAADVVLIPLEDGDRAIALKEMNKKIIAIDLNPISRTSLTANITIVDELSRAIKNMISFIKIIGKLEEKNLKKIVENFDNRENIKEILRFISERFRKMAIG